MVDLSFESLASVFGLVVALGYFAGVAAGFPLALGAAPLSRWVHPVSRAIVYVAVLPALGVLVLAVAVASLEDPVGGVPGALGLAVTLALLWGVPLVVGRALLVRYAGLDAEQALYDTLLGLPVGLLASLLVFVAPGGFARRNILFLDGAAAVVAWAAFPAVLVFVPVMVAMAVARYGGGRKKTVVG
jgi:hypothetical protein